jgi:drug/metabolite transporter (DMT)-like permease
VSAPTECLDSRTPAADALAKAQHREGVLLGLVGVVCFSVTLPVTRLAVAQLGGTFVGLGRAVGAAVLAGILLAVRREPLPERRHWPGLLVVALGVVVGFPLLSAIALRGLPASHAAVLVGLLPAATAVMAVARAGERPSVAFWLSCAAGALAVLIFAMAEGAGMPRVGDLLLVGAVLSAAVAYAEGGRLAREMEGWRVISWALVLTVPFLVVPVWLSAGSVGHASPSVWWGFAYLSCVSMFLGFFAWYRGLALGGVAQVGQIQLLQPVLTLAWAALLLGERIRPLTLGASLLVIGSVALTQRTRTGPKPPAIPL